MKHWILICALFLAVLGCNRSPGENGSSPAASSSGASGTQPTSDELAAVKSMMGGAAQPASAGGEASPVLPAGHPPIPTAPDLAQPPAAGGALPAGHPPIGGPTGELAYDVPDEWVSKPPSSSMRKAVYTLPRAEGDEEDGELILFYFGPGQGGGVEANLERWTGMFRTPENAALPENAAKRETFDAGGMKVTQLDVSGKYAPSPMPGMPAQGARDHFRMIAAVVEAPSGNWFFRATGPAATMEKHTGAIRKMLESVRH